MSCYFIVDVYIDEKKGRGSYADYIEKVKPIVEGFGGEYLIRTENIVSLSPLRSPDRVIVIRFSSREKLDACFASDEYQKIMHERADNVDARALIVEGRKLSAEQIPVCGDHLSAGSSLNISNRGFWRIT